MRRWLLVLTLVVANSTATAEALRPTALTAATTSAESATKTAERQVARLAEQRAALARRYQEELGAIDRLKNQRPSWRRDRELRESMSDSSETANSLSASARDLEKAKAGLEGARRAYLAAIEAELGSGVAPARALQLAQAKAQLAPQLKDAPRRIVIPDFEVDPLADPEELDQRAAELRASEDDLGRQLAGLNAQASELDRLVLLRRQHERAETLFNREDDEPHRNTAKPTETDEGGGRNPNTPSGGPNFENFVPIVLADVIDATTINSFAAAQRSGDPAQRAEAAHKTHDAVARRLDQVRRRRLEIEERARQLRSPR
jgi:hypothetical protein